MNFCRKELNEMNFYMVLNYRKEEGAKENLLNEMIKHKKLFQTSIQESLEVKVIIVEKSIL